MSDRSWALWLLIVLAAGGALRAIHLDADPDARFGTGYLTDEGFYAKNARLRVQEGLWVRPGDQHNLLFYAPGRVLLCTLAFALFGPGLVVARALSVASGVLLALLAALWLRRRVTPAAGLVAALFVAVDPGLVQLSRLAVAEPVQLLFAAASFAALAGNPLRWSNLGGCLAVWLLAFLTKATAVAFLPGIALALLLVGRHERALGRGILLTAVTVVVGLVAWFSWRLAFTTLVPDGEAILATERGFHGAGFGSVTDLIERVRMQRALLGLTSSPVVGIVALATVGGSLLGWMPRPETSLARTRLCVISMLVGQAAFYSLLGYQPPRYFLGLGFSAALAAAIALHGSLPGQVAPPRPGRARMAAELALWLGASLLVLRQLPTHGAGLAGASLVAVGALAAVASTSIRERPARARLGRVALAISCVVPLFRAGRYLLHPGYVDRTERARIARHLGPGDVVLGFMADSFTLDTAAGSVVLWPPYNVASNPAERFGVTALLISDAEREWISRLWPRLLDCSTEQLRVSTGAVNKYGSLSFRRLDPRCSRREP